MGVSSKPKPSVNDIGHKFKQTIRHALRGEHVRQLGRQTKFKLRSTSRLDGSEFVEALVIASVNSASASLRTITSLVEEIKPSAKMTYQAIGQRINSPRTSKFVESLFRLLVEEKLNLIHRELDKSVSAGIAKAFKDFSNVYVEDSTICTLQAELAEHFRGAGGGCSDAGEAGVKINVVYDLKTAAIKEVTLHDARTPDQKIAPNILKIAQAGDLVLRDLGYAHMQTIERFNARGVYWMSRLQGNRDVYLHETDQKPVDLARHLDELCRKGKKLDIMVYVTNRKVRCRLVAYPAPPEVERERRRKYNKSSKYPIQSLSKRLSYTILITNIPKEMLSQEIVGTIYTVRWQIELMFKSWKSQLKINYLKGIDNNRINTLIYCRLIAIVIINTIYRCVQELSSDGKEISLYKLVSWLLHDGRWSRLVGQQFDATLWELLMAQADKLLTKEHRTRKTTLRCILEEESFVDIYSRRGFRGGKVA